MNKNTAKPWSPYLGGILSGLLIIISVWLSGNYFGAAASFVRSTGHIERALNPEHIKTLEYFIKKAPLLDWEMAFLGGIFMGSLLASLASRTFRPSPVPPAWAEKFGASRMKRFIAAFFGGVLAMFGACLAGGCPSGHGFSGMLQLSLSGVITLAGFLMGGIISAHMLYRRK